MPEVKPEDVTSSSSEDVPPPPSLLMIVNDMGMEEEAEEDVVKPECSSPEENKNPEGVKTQLHVKELSRVKTSESRERETSSYSTPPPALSPAYSISEDVEKMEEDVEEVKKPVGMRKVESSPAIVRLEKEKRTYKKKDKDAVPFSDPNAPKRNRSAYVHFMISRRSAYSKATMSQRDINLNLAADWTKLNQEERIPFHKKAEEEKAKYLVLIEEYKKTDSHKEFQKKRAQYVKSQNASATTSSSKSSKSHRKRKHQEEDSEDDGNEEEKVQMTFPKTSVFCPLLNRDDAPATSSSSSSLQYAGPIFTPEFMTYNKTRDSYRRQLAIERSTVEHELEALREHDVEVKIQKQQDRIDSLEERIDGTMEVMRQVFSGVGGAKDHLDDIDSLTEWLRTLTKVAGRKAVKEALQKHCKSTGNSKK